VEDILTPFVQVKPNPVVDYLELGLEDEVWEVQIFNEMGQLVLENYDFNAKSPLNVSFLNNGMYFMLMRRGDEIHRTKFVKIANT
jgi:hypothetical protein